MASKSAKAFTPGALLRRDTRRLFEDETWKPGKQPPLCIQLLIDENGLFKIFRIRRSPD
jgi:hypothetical protein